MPSVSMVDTGSGTENTVSAGLERSESSATRRSVSMVPITASSTASRQAGGWLSGRILFCRRRPGARLPSRSLPLSMVGSSTPGPHRLTHLIGGCGSRAAWQALKGRSPSTFSGSGVRLAALAGFGIATYDLRRRSRRIRLLPGNRLLVPAGRRSGGTGGIFAPRFGVDSLRATLPLGPSL